MDQKGEDNMFHAVVSHLALIVNWNALIYQPLVINQRLMPSRFMKMSNFFPQDVWKYSIHHICNLMSSICMHIEAIFGKQ